jgi:conjugative relaxase-like TrwC/TraI family protein
MVASISGRGRAQAALNYYEHLGRDDYYLRDAAPLGRWAGEGPARLSMSGPVTRSDFDAALNGLDPRTGDRLAALGGRSRDHAAGWDMTFSAPKSVSVLWALSEPRDREAIESAHRLGVATALWHLEQAAAWARRGKGGAIRERTAGLLMAAFDHHTSRELDPQLHTHVFVFNLAPRQDGTWGTLLGRELYRAQKRAGAEYREVLATELERAGYALERGVETLRVTAIPHHIERVFSKRRQAIEAAAEAHGYRTPKGMELAALRTRRAKRDAPRDALFERWREEARTLGYELKRESVKQCVAVHHIATAPRVRNAGKSPIAREATVPHERPSPATLVRSHLQTTNDARGARLGAKLQDAARAIDQPSAMPGLAVDLKPREQEYSRD